ncbi:MAG: GSCFA domain-containing protein [Bacteroidales bacterium]|nr:GSCFA domain-containing protein [Bacteroidales bacterium]
MKYNVAMIKLQTPVEFPGCGLGLGLDDGYVVLGSCFADEIGSRMVRGGIKACVNPFGTMYNPVSVCNSIMRLSSGVLFGEDDCVEMGAGAGLVCSFSHHTSFARATSDQFLENANSVLAGASAFFREAGAVAVTLGTSWCFRHLETGEIVSNCLKRDAREFSREMLSPDISAAMLRRMVSRFPDKKFIFTVSPIRHMADGAHGNQLSKSALHMAVNEVCLAFPERTTYFPSYEIMMDELRDYRFYAEDMVHPSSQAVDYIWQRFCEWAFTPEEREKISAAEKEYRRSLHRPNLQR